MKEPRAQRATSPVPSSPLDYRTYGVARKDREPLLRFMLDALESAGCRVLYFSEPNRAPFRISFETPEGERLGILAYAFFANDRKTKNRPEDEHRFQIKYGPETPELHPLWQDPYGLYTTLFLGINPELGFFVGADPVLHSPTKFFISLEFKRHHAEAVLAKGWHCWERQTRKRGLDEPVETLVGGTASSFLRYVRFEREALGEDQGHRQLIAEKTSNMPASIHHLVQEFQLSEKEVLDLISGARMLKMAVRGWVAEEHLLRALRETPGVTDCYRIEKDSGPDISLRYSLGRPITIECKNVLRTSTREHLAKLDFQRTRAAKADACSRYYSPQDFDVVAACLHAQTEDWSFRFRLSRTLDPHRKCPGKLANNVVIDSLWASDPIEVLRAATEL